MFIFSVERTLPFPSKWELHQGLVPLQEDYFDYHPVMMNLQPSPSGFVIMSRENVSSIQFKNFKVNIRHYNISNITAFLQSNLFLDYLSRKKQREFGSVAL